MKSALPLALVFVICLGPLPNAAPSPTPMKVIPIGQLSGPVLRRMAATSCGPFFTLSPTDAHGGGLLNLAVQTPDDQVAVVTMHIKAVRVKYCDSCDTPLFTSSGDESSARGDLAISQELRKLSPCLKSAKVTKR